MGQETKETRRAGTASGAAGRSGPALILASASPRRLDLLASLGLSVQVVPSRVEEHVEAGMEPQDVVLKLAREKALEVASRASAAGAPAVVLGADTIVVLDGRILGKPESRQEAAAMLRRLSGRPHEVYTGVALVRLPDGRVVDGFEASTVSFRQLAPEEIEAYVTTDEPMDKAGSYALQGIASAFVEKIEGCFTNVIGLPIPLVVRLLRDEGISILGLP